MSVPFLNGTVPVRLRACRGLLALTAVALLVAGGVPPAGAAQSWRIDEAHTSIAFKIEAVGFPATRGRFTRYAGRILVDFERPAKSFTGFTVDNSAQGGKWVELLKEIAPGTVRVALLFNPTTAAPVKLYMPSIETAGASSGVQVSAAAVHGKDEIEAVIAAQAREPGGGLIVLPDTFNTTNRDAIIAQAARHKVPAVYFNHFFPDSGGLVSYGADFTEQFREAANYVHQILKGANPGELPVQAPTKFELVVNLKTAKALALPGPARLLTRADKVIE